MMIRWTPLPHVNFGDQSQFGTPELIGNMIAYGMAASLAFWIVVVINAIVRETVEHRQAHARR